MAVRVTVVGGGEFVACVDIVVVDARVDERFALAAIGSAAET